MVVSADEQVTTVLWAIEVLEGRVRAATSSEIGRLVRFDEVELGQVLCRAVVGGWAEKLIVRSEAERAGVRAGTAVYRLTSMADHRSHAPRLASADGA